MTIYMQTELEKIRSKLTPLVALAIMSFSFIVSWFVQHLLNTQIL